MRTVPMFLPDVERGFGAATSIFGYRMAMLVAGPLAFIMADRIGWQNTYFLMAAIMIIGICGTFMGQRTGPQDSPAANLEEAVWGPLKDFFTRKSAFLFILLIILYKLGDAYAGALTTTFLLRGVHFTLTEVGTLNKAIGIIATIVGALFGGTLMVKLGLFRSLMFFGVLQMVSNLAFMVLAWIGKNYPAMIIAVSFENAGRWNGVGRFRCFFDGPLQQKLQRDTVCASCHRLPHWGRCYLAHVRLCCEGRGLAGLLFYHNPCCSAGTCASLVVAR